MPKLESERSLNATGSLVQNLRAGFVPPEPPNRTSRHSATAARVSGRLRVGAEAVADRPCRRGSADPRIRIGRLAESHGTQPAL